MKFVKKYLEEGQAEADRRLADLTGQINDLNIQYSNLGNLVNEYRFAVQTVTQRYPLAQLQKEQARLETELEALTSSIKDLTEKAQAARELSAQFKVVLKSLKNLS